MRSSTLRPNFLNGIDDSSENTNMAVEKKSAAKAVPVEASDDIENIVGEIQELRQGMAQVPKLKVVETEAPVLEEFRGSAGDVSMEETLGELKQDPKSTLFANEEEVMNEETEDTHGENNDESEMHDESGMDSDSEGSLTMVLTGTMRLRLKYQAGDQTVSIGFADNSLKVELADGTEFRIPMKRPHLKAA